MKFTEKDIRTMVAESIRLILKENRQDELQGWHGTKVKFDKFSLDFLRSGEGTQQYGEGVYVSECEETGRMYAYTANYADKNKKGAETRRANSIKAWRPYVYTIENVIKRFAMSMPPHKIKDILLKKFKKRKLPTSGIENIEINSWLDCKRLLTKYRRLAVGDFKGDNYLYRVEIPDTGYIDWDETDQDLINRIYEVFKKNFDISYIKKASFKTFGELFIELRGWKSDKKPLPTIDVALSQKVISKTIEKLGFVGITADIGRAHGNDDLGKNFVIFDPDNVKIIDVEQFY